MKRLHSIYKNRIKIVGYYSEEWKDIIGMYPVKFIPMKRKVEKRFGKYSTLTLICKDGKTIYKRIGEISMED